MSKEQDQDAAIAQAAGYIAGAVATCYLGPGAGAVAEELVESIAGALLGGDDDKFQREVVSRLQVIEGKIDSILRFLNVQLRDLLLDTLTENDIRMIVLSMETDRVPLRVALDQFRRKPHPNYDDAKAVQDAATKVLSSGFSLFSLNPGRFIVAIPYVANAFGAIREISKVDPKNYDVVLIDWADEYKTRIGPWLMKSIPGAVSFPQALEAATADLTLAQQVMQDFIKVGPGVNLRYVVGVAQIGQVRSLALCADYRLNEDYTTSANYIGNVGPVFEAFLSWGSDVSALAASVGAKAHPNISPFFGDARGISNATEYWRYYTDSFTANFYHSAGLLGTLPDRVKALKFVVDTLTPFVNGLTLLASLKHDDKTLRAALDAA